jgi:hypothetical protein
MNNNPDFATHGNSVWNQQIIDYLNENVFNNLVFETMDRSSDHFLEYYPTWIASSKLNKITGMDKLPYRFVSLGTTQGLDWWHYYCAANGLRLRTFRGEYPYNRDVLLDGEWTQDRYIDDTPLVRGDAVIISLPFSGHGRKHDRMEELFDTCDALDIPVFVDCAWFGTCYGIEADLDRKCVKMIAFSTTKGLSSGNWRAGIVFSRLNEGSLAMQTEWYHGIHLHLALANALMSKFSPDTAPKKYMDSQRAICEHYGLETTNTVHIAIAPLTEEWRRFHRDEKYYRVNIRDALKRHKNKKGSFYTE